MKNRALEICCDSLESVETSRRAGASRVELCSGLSEGGVTPSAGLISAAVATGIPVNVLIRPRGGDFVYSEGEASLMEADVRMAVAEGANGVVIGALLPDGALDLPLCRRLCEAAGGREVTFHRAFDVCRCPELALEEIISLGCRRILTSGQAPTAPEGAAMLRHLHSLASGRILLMAGSGVNSRNAAALLAESEADELHASARSPQMSAMTFRRGVSMSARGNDEYTRLTADEKEIKELLKIIETI